MKKKFKYMHSPEFFEQLCPILKKVIPQFDERKFVYKIFDTRWPDLDAKQRTRQISRALQECLPLEYPKAIEMVVTLSNLLQTKPKEQRYSLYFLARLYGKMAPTFRGVSATAGLRRTYTTVALGKNAT